MGSRARKKWRKSAGYREFIRNHDIPDEERQARIRKRIEERREARARSSQYKKSPLHSVRGIRKVRGCCASGPSNGAICMCCLRRAGHSIGEEYEVPSMFKSSEMVKTRDFVCNNCGSKSIVFLSSLTRLPRRTANKGAWKRFFKDQCGVSLYFIHRNKFPDDFMAKV